jgi:DNA primase
MPTLKPARPPVDTAALKKGVNLLTLVGPNSHLRKIAGTRGGEYAGACPFCGGDDRFRVQPKADPPQWWCRGCSPDNRWHDAIDFVMKRDGLDFEAACAALGELATGKFDNVQVESAPASLWHSRAERFIAAAEESLWADSRDGLLALKYLRLRGLTDATIRRWRIGWHPTTAYERREQWGLPMETERRKVWLPRGIVIPWTVGGQLAAVKLRRPDVDVRSSGDKYIALAGSRPTLFGADLLGRHPCAILLESELDAILLDQEAGDLVGVAATGSAKGILPPDAIAVLLPVSRLLVAYNADAAGEQAAGRLLKLTARARRVLVPMGKDPTEMHQRGGRIRDWAALLAAKHGPPERPVEPEAYLADMLATLRPAPSMATDPPRGVCRHCGAPAAPGLVWNCEACADRRHAEHKQEASA